jgi:hypothetical protein
MISEESKDIVKDRAPIAAFGVGSGAGMLAHQTDKGVNSNNKIVKAVNKLRKSKAASVVLPVAGGISAYNSTIKATGKRMSPRKRETIGALSGGLAGGSIYKIMSRTKGLNPLKTGLASGFGAMVGGLTGSVINQHKKKKAAQNDQ